ncbi:unannotated protein [freshwater metagenome]|uniref:Unannotated protein n=1 Tax=freshwater metagenome TaxID=449393 RepID=A0A6J7HVH1_9ZZZZ|nr:hypothetical protein [Actinomycetota bacterium]
MAQVKIRSLWQSRPAWVAPLVVGLVAALGLYVAERIFQSRNADWLPDGLRIHDMSSNNSQQNMTLWDMNVFGIRSLWYDHIYPPLMDFIRFQFMQIDTRGGGSTSPIEVDRRLHVLFAALFGVVTSVVYLWVRDLTKSGWWALGASFIWAIAPASIITMTLLEPTPLAISSIAVTFYLLYRFLKTRKLGYATGFFAALLIASLSRNAVQIHVLVILAIAVIAFWFMSKNRSWWIQGLNIMLVALIFVWPVRSQIMFSTFDVSSHTGYHRSGALWIDPKSVPETPDTVYPQNILENGPVFSSAFNTQEILRENYRLTRAANDFMMQHPVEAVQRMIDSVKITSENALTPVSVTTRNYMIEGVFWKSTYEFMLSGWRYLLLVLASAAVIIWSRGWRGTKQLMMKYGWFAAFWILIAIPVAFSNRYWTAEGETAGPFHTEASRLKGLIEIPVYSLVVYALWIVVQKINIRWKESQSVTQD